MKMETVSPSEPAKQIEQTKQRDVSPKKKKRTSYRSHRCCVCGNNSSSSQYFCLPGGDAQTERRKKWLRVLHLSESESKFKRLHVCSNHFEEKNFRSITSERGKTLLENDAVPSIGLDVPKQIRIRKCYYTCFYCGKKDSENNRCYFPFPKNPKIFKKWIKFCDTAEEYIIPSTKLCSDHFSPGSIVGSMEFGRRRSLRENAVPTIREPIISSLQNGTSSDDHHDEPFISTVNEHHTETPIEVDDAPVEITVKIDIPDEISIGEDDEHQCFLCKKKGNDKNTHYFKFPENPEIFKRWVEFCKCAEEVIPSSARLCSDHFDPCSILTILKENAVPTIKELAGSSVQQGTSFEPSRPPAAPTPVSLDFDENGTSTGPVSCQQPKLECMLQKEYFEVPKYLGQIKSSHLSTLPNAKACFIAARDLAFKKQKQIKCLQEDLRRARKKIATLEVLAIQKQENLILSRLGKN